MADRPALESHPGSGNPVSGIVKILNTHSKYGFVSLALHWIIVLGIVVQWLLAENDAIPLHQSLGMVMLALAVLRLLWRLSNPRPAWPADMKPYEVGLARIVHVAFYALLFAIPVSGWALGSVEDEPLRFFNQFDIPRLVLGSEETLEEVHETLFNGLAALALLHVIGAAKHWLIGRKSRAAEA
jgi:cytochrome b561